jgi:pyruvate/2-oxoglutarate dehydrogenase complex dihydrolipoamide acyltransferase (E2) component
METPGQGDGGEPAQEPATESEAAPTPAPAPAPEPEPEPRYQYRVLMPGLIREDVDMASPKVGKLEQGEEIVVTARKAVGDTVRVQFDRGWASVTSKSGRPLLQLVREKE